METKHKDNIISILLPTRGRTDALKTSLDSLFDLADDVGKLELLLGMDDDDAASSQWVQENLLPDLDNVYVNALARHSSGDWFFFWNDDAVMLTQGWDTRVREKTSEFCCIRIPTHNCHPYAIFPIIPRAWLDICGYLSDHQLNDAWISQISYILDIMINVDTGANQDDTYQRRVMFEFDPSDPRDFNYPSRRQQRMQDAVKISNFLTAQGRNMTWFGRVLKGQQDPWAKMTGPEYDPNKQIKQWK